MVLVLGGGPAKPAAVYRRVMPVEVCCMAVLEVAGHAWAAWAALVVVHWKGMRRSCRLQLTLGPLVLADPPVRLSMKSFHRGSSSLAISSPIHWQKATSGLEASCSAV